MLSLLLGRGLIVLGLCRIVENPQSSGKWNIFLSKPQVFCGFIALCSLFIYF